MTPAQLAPPLERFYGIRDRFAISDSFADVVVALLLLIAVLAIMYGVLRAVHRRQNRRVYHPRKLMRELLRATPLTVTQRDLVRRVARELRLSQPAVLLLSPQVFCNHANRWMSLTRSANPQTRARLDRLAAALFPAPSDPPAPIRQTRPSTEPLRS